MRKNFALIDQHLLQRHLDWTRMSLLLGGCLLTGWVASGLRYLQLVRLSGLAMRSVQRLFGNRAEAVNALAMTKQLLYDKPTDVARMIDYFNRLAVVK